MKICIFCHDAFMSGANLALLDYVNTNKKDSFYIVIPRKNENFKEYFKNDNVQIIYGNYFCLVDNLVKMPLVYRIKKSLKKIYMSTFGKIALKNLFKKLKCYQFDLVLSNSFVVTYGAKFATENALPHIWYIREFMENDHKIRHYHQKEVMNYVKSSHAIFISDVIQKHYEEKYPFLSFKTIYDQIAYNEKYSKIHPKFKSKTIQMMIAGILSEGKGQMEAIKAVEYLNLKGIKCQLSLYGAGPLEHEIKKYIQEKKLKNVHLKGYANNLTELRKKYDIALVCSECEALGRVTVEAMYYGNLVIGANTGCTPYIIENNKTGYIYQYGNPKNLADIIESVSQKTKENNQIISNAQKYAIKHFSKSISKKINDYFKEVLQGE